MGTETDYKVICFYLGKECRYGEDAPPEEQMECEQCPAYIMWKELVLDKAREIAKEIVEKTSRKHLTDEEHDLDSDK